MKNVVEFLVKAKDEASKVIDDVSKKLWWMSDTAGKSAKSFSDRGKSNKETFEWMQKYGAIAGAAVIWVWTAAVMQASKMQELRIELDVLTWSAENWMKIFSDIQKAAAKTPFESEDLVQTTSTMLQFGIAQKDVMKDMMMLGDISGGNANKLKSLWLVFWQISSSWKLTGGDLLQLINLWFNPLKQMSDKTGESMASLREKMEDGAISFDMVKQTMIDATTEWWLFFWMMDKKSQTFGGIMSTLKDNIWIALAAMWWFADGEVVKWWLLDTLTEWMKTLMPYLEQFTNRAKENPVYAKNIMLVVAGVAALITIVWSLWLIIPSIVTWFTAIAWWLWIVKAAFIAVGGPVTILIALIGVLAYTIYKNRDEIVAATKILRESLKKTFNEMREWLKWRWEDIKKYFSDLRNTITMIATATRENIKNIFTNAINMIVTFISSARDAISGAFNNMVWWIAGVAKNVLNGAIWIIEWFVNRAVAWLNNLIALANAVPGVSIAPIKTVSFGRLTYWWIAGEWFFWSDGWKVRWPAWIDKVPTMLTAGELVLNRAQQSNIANQLEWWNWWKAINLVFENNNFYWSDRQMLKNMCDMLVEELKLHTGFASF